MKALRLFGLLGAAALWLAVGFAGTGCVESAIPSSDVSPCKRFIPAGSECATVYAFAEPANNDLGHVELCVREQDLSAAQDEHGIAWPSDDVRFSKYAIAGIDPPCFWCCGNDCSRGANAYGGSYCLPGEQ